MDEDKWQALLRDAIQKIGTTNAYNLRWSFERDIKDMAEETKIRTKEAIAALDRNNENKTYEGGCEFLLSSFLEKVHQNNDST